MLIDREQVLSHPRIATEMDRAPALARFLEMVQSDCKRFSIDESAGGVDLMPVADSQGAWTAGRCRLKLFSPRPNSDRLCAFFYKRSNLAWSRDRFSYGGVEFRPEQLTEAAARSWLAWLHSGFDPASRPERLRRAFLYDVPE